MPRKSSGRKPARKSSRRKPARRGAKEGKSSRRKPTRRGAKAGKSSGRKSTRKSSGRKSTRKSPIRKSPTITGGNEYLFSVWYVNKPKVNNKLTVINPTVKLDDDNEWVFSGFVKANSKEEAKAWLRTLGSVKNYSGTYQERIEI